MKSTSTRSHLSKLPEATGTCVSVIYTLECTRTMNDSLVFVGLIRHCPIGMHNISHIIHIYTLLFSPTNRAEDWNLAAPLATCNLHVERRDDGLVLEFRKLDDGTNNIFAQAVIDCSIQQQQQQQQSATTDDTTKSSETHPIRHWIEGTVDSSRYFTLRIVSTANGREAFIGFGFRDRDQATDLREALQFYEASMRREYEATVISTTPGSKYTISKLAEGERIHIRTGKEGNGGGDSSNSSIVKSKKKETSTQSLPVLLKKPPPAPVNIGNSFTTSETSSFDGTNEIGQPIVHADDKKIGDDDGDDDWESDFVSANA
jgi:Protein of unknown function (DUF1681)